MIGKYGKTFGALLTDLSKAFDSLPRELIITKHYPRGFDYLSTRKQRVEFSNTYSLGSGISYDTAQKMKQIWRNPQFPTDLVTFTEEILNPPNKTGCFEDSFFLGRGVNLTPPPSPSLFRVNGNFNFGAVRHTSRVNPGGYYILTLSLLFYFLEGTEGTEPTKYVDYTRLYGHSRVI